MDLFLPTLMRLVLPLTILRFPLGGFLISIIADAVDWFIFPLSDAHSYVVYQKWDKFMDMYFMSLALAISFSIKERIVSRILFILFILRLIGVIFVETIDKREMLVFFPNIFLGYFLFYFIYKKISKKDHVLANLSENVPVLIIIAIPTVFMEYFNHYLRKLPWQYNWGEIVIPYSYHLSIFISQMAWLLIILTPPVILLLWKTKR